VLGDHTRPVLTEVLGAARADQLIADGVAIDGCGR
jgi:hypothetical protein